MSHLPPQKCWTCSKPMTGEIVMTSRLECEICGLASCGECILKHYRKAHPSAYMKSVVPVLRTANIDRTKGPYFRSTMPAPDNVIPLSRRVRS